MPLAYALLGIRNKTRGELLPVHRALPRLRVQRKLRSSRFRMMHRAGFRTKQIDLQTDLQLGAETGIVRAHFTANQANAGNDKDAVPPAIRRRTRRTEADLRLDQRRRMIHLAGSIANLTAYGNIHIDMHPGIRAMAFQRRPPGLRSALLHHHKPEGRHGALR